MATVKLLLDTRSIKKDGTHSVKLYVAHQGKDFFISTNISVKIEDWIGGDKEPTKSKKLNSTLIQILVQAQAHIYKLRADNKLVTMDIKMLRKALMSQSLDQEQPVIQPTTLVATYFEKFITAKDCEGTKSVYTQTLTKIGKYCDLNTLSLDDINLVWLREFESNMKSDGLSVNTMSIHMRNLRAIFNSAIDEDVAEQNAYPFRKFKIKSERTAKRSLTIDQLRILHNYPCQSHQTKYRDLFMLIFYMLGINMVDLVNLKEIKDDRIGFRRAKTGRLYSIKVEPEAMNIIERYRGETHLLDILDIYGNYKDFLHRMNNNLQKIGVEEIINRKNGRPGKKKITPLFSNLTTYWARHTWATVAASLDIPKETIAAALGHGGDTVTDIYIDFDQKKVDKANRKVIDYLLKVQTERH